MCHSQIWWKFALAKLTMWYAVFPPKWLLLLSQSSEPPFCPHWANCTQKFLNVVVPWPMHVYQIWSILVTERYLFDCLRCLGFWSKYPLKVKISKTASNTFLEDTYSCVVGQTRWKSATAYKNYEGGGQNNIRQTTAKVRAAKLNGFTTDLWAEVMHIVTPWITTYEHQRQEKESLQLEMDSFA